MYTEFFGLSDKPFNQVPDPDFLYLSPNHKKALTMLEYGIASHAGFTVITGAIGAGKTTLIRALLNKIDDNCLIGLINNTHESFGSLLEWVLDALDVKSNSVDNAGRYRDYVNFVIERYAEGRRVVLIIDEAQNLTSKQMKTLITRAGPGTKIVCLGNIAQIDTPYLSETTSGLTYVVDHFKYWQHSGHITLLRGERSRLADYASENL